MPMQVNACSSFLLPAVTDFGPASQAEALLLATSYVDYTGRALQHLLDLWCAFRTATGGTEALLWLKLTRH